MILHESPADTCCIRNHAISEARYPLVCQDGDRRVEDGLPGRASLNYLLAEEIASVQLLDTPVDDWRGLPRRTPTKIPLTTGSLNEI